MNDGGYNNPQFDALVDQASNTQRSWPSAFNLFHQAEAILNEDVPTTADLFLRERAPDQALCEGLAIERHGSQPVALHVYPGAPGELS